MQSEECKVKNQADPASLFTLHSSLFTPEMHTVKRLFVLPMLLAVAALFALMPEPARTDQSFSKVADEVNQKLVKLFGAGGIRGLPSYGTGVLISKDGYILTVNSHILDTRDLRVHTYDGTKYHADVIVREPELDIALCKINRGKGPTARKIDIEHYFDPAKAAKMPVLESGTGVLAFSNQFQIATRDEPVSVQRGVIAAHSKLLGRVGIFQAAYRGDVYVIDAITNNPGAGGGVIVTRKGELIGLIGKELRNELTNTWINYAVPFNTVIDGTDEEGNKVKISIMDVVTKKDKYRPVKPRAILENVSYHGIVLVPNVVERTPPYVEEVEPGSPAEAAKLKPDDLIVYVDGIPVPDINTFNQMMATYAPGEVKLEVQRGDKLETVPLKLVKPKDTPKKK